MTKRIIYPIIILLILTVLTIPAHAADASSQAGRVTTSGSRLTVRSGASTGASAVASLNNGSYVTLISKSGSWWRVEYANGKYGYCHADYITVASGSASTVTTNSGALNVRSGAGTSYSKVASLGKGQTVIILSTSNGWSKILYHGTKIGYVSAQYLSNYHAAVSLWVPNLKQMDSRWASAQVGESGRTFAQIGCATTAIAMVESHRRGYTIYPDVMAEELTYTPSGSVYWPEQYSTVTNASNYLSAIYTRLKQGKPVLLGVRNAAGSQHWVVVTGFTGGEALIASRFTIHDPGTFNRTNLQQLLEVYPNFYKYFVY